MKAHVEHQKVAGETIPIIELKVNVGQLLGRLRETRRAVLLTDEGQPAPVVITPEELEVLRFREQLFAAESEGVADVEAGRLDRHRGDHRGV